jgi:hypothetical protein
MYIPFREEFEDLFRNSGGIWLKIGGGALVGILVAIGAVHRMIVNGLVEFDPVRAVGTVVGTALIGALAVILLLLKDVVQKRIQAGQRVSFLLRLSFGMGVTSLLLWAITAILVVLLATALVFAHK